MSEEKNKNDSIIVREASTEIFNNILRKVYRMENFSYIPKTHHKSEILKLTRTRLWSVGVKNFSYRPKTHRKSHILKLTRIRLCSVGVKYFRPRTMYSTTIFINMIVYSHNGMQAYVI